MHPRVGGDHGAARGALPRAAALPADPARAGARSAGRLALRRRFATRLLRRASRRGRRRASGFASAAGRARPALSTGRSSPGHEYSLADIAWFPWLPRAEAYLDLDLEDIRRSRTGSTGWPSGRRSRPRWTIVACADERERSCPPSSPRTGSPSTLGDDDVVARRRPRAERARARPPARVDPARRRRARAVHRTTEVVEAFAREVGPAASPPRDHGRGAARRSTTRAAASPPRRRCRRSSSPAIRASRCSPAGSRLGQGAWTRARSCSTSRGSSSSRGSSAFPTLRRAARAPGRPDTRARRCPPAGGVRGAGRRAVRSPPGPYPRRAERRGLDAVRGPGHAAAGGRRKSARRAARRRRRRRVLPLGVAIGAGDRSRYAPPATARATTSALGTSGVAPRGPAGRALGAYTATRSAASTKLPQSGRPNASHSSACRRTPQGTLPAGRATSSALGEPGLEDRSGDLGVELDAPGDVAEPEGLGAACRSARAPGRRSAGTSNS